VITSVIQACYKGCCVTRNWHANCIIQVNFNIYDHVVLIYVIIMFVTAALHSLCWSIAAFSYFSHSVFVFFSSGALRLSRVLKDLLGLLEWAFLLAGCPSDCATDGVKALNDVIYSCCCCDFMDLLQHVPFFTVLSSWQDHFASC